MILAGDIGGTKTLVGLFEPRDGRPAPVSVHSFPTTEYPGLPAIVDAFFDSHAKRPPITAAVFGVAGPVINQTAQMTNVEWRVDVDELVRTFAFRCAALLNDLEAMAYAVPVLEGDELFTLQQGRRQHEGNMGIIAAGTGLGGSLLHRIAGRYVPVASEVGHSDFAARTDRELAFARYARDRFGRCEIEHVVCGPGLLNLSGFTHQNRTCEATAGSPTDPSDVSAAALDGTCPHCAEALDMFIEAYGAVAGNMALIGVTTGGMFIGGGIAPRLVPAFQTGRFIDAFRAKEPMRALVESVPVHVILNSDAGLLGAAVYANALARNSDAV